MASQASLHDDGSPLSLSRSAGAGGARPPRVPRVTAAAGSPLNHAMASGDISSSSSSSIAKHTTNTNTTNGDSGGDASPSSFTIVVVARVRPFNQSEVRRWQKERQKRLACMLPQLAAAAAAAAVAAGGNGLDDQNGIGGGGVTASNAERNAAIAAVRAAVNRRRHNQRQPFGPGGNKNITLSGGGSGSGDDTDVAVVDANLLATLSATNPTIAEALRQVQLQLISPSGGKGGGGGSPSLEDTLSLLTGGGGGIGAFPDTIVEVEPDMRTLTLHNLSAASNNHHHSNNVNRTASSGTGFGISGGGGKTAKAAFTFDHVFSAFAPSVELFVPGISGHNSNSTAGSPLYNRQQQPYGQQQQQQLALCEDSAQLSSEQDTQAEAEQEAIYAVLGAPLLESALAGFNACIFAYGQTSSGKTYTMLGTRRHRGVIPRLLHSLFMHLNNKGQSDINSNGNNDRNGVGDGLTPTRMLSTLSLPRITPDRSNITTTTSGSGVVNNTTTTISNSSNGTGAIHYVDVSYMEIYNEQVRDMLKQRPKNAILHYHSRFDTKDVDHSEYQTLKVRQHPERGLFVDGLTSVRVGSWTECERYLKQGSALRTQAATAMNATSSRSHAIFQVTITRVENLGGRVRGKAVTSQRVSKINLVDLAGSERNKSNGGGTTATGVGSSTGAVNSSGDDTNSISNGGVSGGKNGGKKRTHIQEANSINVSLSTLRRVIDALVFNSHLHHSGCGNGGVAAPLPRAPMVVPYRDSLLTYVLSDNFGGNSKTVMCANLSPSEYNFNETESTLRYASLARGVRNRVRLNEDPVARVIHELQSRLSAMVAELAMAPSAHLVAELELDLEENAAALVEVQDAYDALEKSLQTREKREQSLIKQIAQQADEEQGWRAEAAAARRAAEDMQAVVERLEAEKEQLMKADRETQMQLQQQQQRQTMQKQKQKQQPKQLLLEQQQPHQHQHQQQQQRPLNVKKNQQELEESEVLSAASASTSTTSQRQIEQQQQQQPEQYQQPSQHQPQESLPLTVDEREELLLLRKLQLLLHSREAHAIAIASRGTTPTSVGITPKKMKKKKATACQYASSPTGAGLSPRKAVQRTSQTGPPRSNSNSSRRGSTDSAAAAGKSPPFKQPQQPQQQQQRGLLLPSPRKGAVARGRAMVKPLNHIANNVNHDSSSIGGVNGVSATPRKPGLTTPARRRPSQHQRKPSLSGRSPPLASPQPQQPGKKNRNNTIKTATDPTSANGVPFRVSPRAAAAAAAAVPVKSRSRPVSPRRDQQQQQQQPAEVPEVEDSDNESDAGSDDGGARKDSYEREQEEMVSAALRAMAGAVVPPQQQQQQLYLPRPPTQPQQPQQRRGSGRRRSSGDYVNDNSRNLFDQFPATSTTSTTAAPVSSCRSRSFPSSADAITAATDINVDSRGGARNSDGLSSVVNNRDNNSSDSVWGDYPRRNTGGPGGGRNSPGGKVTLPQQPAGTFCTETYLTSPNHPMDL